MKKNPRFSSHLQKLTLAEQVAITLEEAIVQDQWQAGDALPTEPELAEAFSVSRAVIRDATRMLAARGLVRAQHGRGVFVTESQAEAFGSALLLALRRSDATVWDVEQFEQMVFPQVCALASEAATETDRADIKRLGEEYIDIFRQSLQENWQHDSISGGTWEPARTAFIAFIRAVFDATHNKVWQLLAKPILQLRSPRQWDDSDMDEELAIRFEKAFIDSVIVAISAESAQEAQQMVSKLMVLPPEAVQAMKKTGVGEVPKITVSQNWKRA